MRSLSLLLTITLIATALFAQDKREDRVLRAQDFAQDPGLAAQSGQSVLLDRYLPAAGSSEPVVRYRLKAARHSFCLSGNDPYFTGLTLSDQAGKSVFHMRRVEHCRAVDLPEGVYDLQISHSDATPNPELLTFVGVDEPSAPLHDANGNPLGGYWAISSAAGSGTLRPLPPPKNIGDIYTNDMPLIVGRSDADWDETSLFSFPPKGPPLPLGPPGFFLDMTYSATLPWVMVSGNHDCSVRPALCNFFGQVPNSYHRTLNINDLGHSQFTFSWASGADALSFSQQSTSLSPYSMQGSSPSQGIPATKMVLNFRYYPDSSQMGALNQGEVAFFEKCNYQGQGTVATNSFDPSGYVLDGNELHQFFSVRLSNNTTVEVSTGVPGGIPSQGYFLFNDTACLPAPLEVANLIYPLDKIIRGDQQFPCPQCRLVNANLSGFNLRGSNWQQADMTGATLSGVQFSAGTNLSGAKFTKATLSNVDFGGSTLTGADFTGATLTCVDLSGTVQSPRDLTKTTFAGVNWIASSSCRSNLSNTLLSTAILPPSFWTIADLTGAVFVDLTKGTQLSSQAKPLDLTGAFLGSQFSGGVARLRGPVRRRSDSGEVAPLQLTARKSCYDQIVRRRS
jgi:uncharacterized protein YjbI with pentapeptide repeats